MKLETEEASDAMMICLHAPAKKRSPKKRDAFFHLKEQVSMEGWVIAGIVAVVACLCSGFFFFFDWQCFSLKSEQRARCKSSNTGSLSRIGSACCVCVCACLVSSLLQSLAENSSDHAPTEPIGAPPSASSGAGAGAGAGADNRLAQNIVAQKAVGNRLKANAAAGDNAAVAGDVRALEALKANEINTAASKVSSGTRA